VSRGGILKAPNHMNHANFIDFLIIQLNQYRNAGRHCTINKAEVQYDRYMTLTQGNN